MQGQEGRTVSPKAEKGCMSQGKFSQITQCNIEAEGKDGENSCEDKKMPMIDILKDKRHDQCHDNHHPFSITSDVQSSSSFSSQIYPRALRAVQ